MRIIALLILALALPLAAQPPAFIQVQDDIMAGTSMQIYLDFAPMSAVAGIPPFTPDPEDLLIRIESLRLRMT